MKNKIIRVGRSLEMKRWETKEKEKVKERVVTFKAEKMKKKKKHEERIRVKIIGGKVLTKGRRNHRKIKNKTREIYYNFEKKKSERTIKRLLEY